MTDSIKPFRLAFREEGEFVAVYFAAPDTMVGALPLGSIRTSVLRSGLFEDYKAMMRKFATIACEDVLGVKPSEFIEEAAPEHERAGRS